MKKVRLFDLLFVCTLVLFVCAAGASAADWPKLAVTVNTSQSGSAVDYGARSFAKTLTRYLGGNVIVNSTAGQLDAVREVMGAEPDGYTLGYVNNTVIINDVVGATEFDSVKDVELIGVVAQGISSWIAIRKDTADKTGVKTFEELIAYTQKNPDKLLISDRLNSSTNACILLLRKVGLLAAPVDAGLSADRLTNFLSGACDIYVGNYGMIEQYVKTGEVICLASCSEQRSAFSPDVPCTYELGYQVQFPVRYYLFGPRGLPEEVVKTLNAAMEKVSKDPQYIADLKGNSNEPLYLDHAAAVDYLTREKETMISLGMGEGKKEEKK